MGVCCNNRVVRNNIKTIKENEIDFFIPENDHFDSVYEELKFKKSFVDAKKEKYCHSPVRIKNK